jgi:hypothetical protein
MAVLAGALGQRDLVVVHDEVSARRCGEHVAWDQVLSFDGLLHNDPTGPGKNGRERAVSGLGNVKYDEYGCWEVGRQTVDQRSERFDPASRCPDYHEIPAIHGASLCPRPISSGASHEP